MPGSTRQRAKAKRPTSLDAPAHADEALVEYFFYLMAHGRECEKLSRDCPDCMILVEVIKPLSRVWE